MRKIGFYLEDDELLRMSAELQAEKAEINLRTFSNSKEFLNALKSACKESILFLDSDIGEKIKGEEVGKICFKMGFENLYLITGFSKRDFPSMSWIKDIGGKEDLFHFWNKDQQ